MDLLSVLEIFVECQDLGWLYIPWVHEGSALRSSALSSVLLVASQRCLQSRHCLSHTEITNVDTGRALLTPEQW